MNQKELASVKKQMKLDNVKMAVNQMAIAVVENQKIKNFRSQDFSFIEESEQILYMQMFKQSLSGKIGKNLLEYSVPADNFKNSGIGDRMCALIKHQLSDDEAVKQVMQEIASSAGYKYPYCLTITHFTQFVQKKSEDAMDVYDLDSDKESEDEGNEFNFILINIADLTLATAELCYDENLPAITKRVSKNSNLVVAPKPTDSIMYPVLNDGQADVNYVMYRTHKPKEPNREIVEEFLHCTYTMSGVEEAAKVASVLRATFGEEIPYNTLTEIKQAINKIDIAGSQESETPKVSEKQFAKVLADSGCDEDTVDTFKKSYETIIGAENSIRTVNAVDTQNTSIKSGDIKVSVKNECADMVSVQSINGRKCLVVELDENVTVDDILVTV
jgi:hypothetical protein